MNTQEINSAAEYIKELSEKTITHILRYELIENTLTVFYENADMKQKADDHGTTELLREMFFKYLSDNGFRHETLTLNFNA